MTSVDTVPVSPTMISGWEPAGERKHGACQGHDNEQQAVAASPPEAIALACEQHGDERTPGKERGQDDTHCRVGEAAIGEGEPDQDRAKAVGKRPRALRRNDPARVRAQPRSS